MTDLPQKWARSQIVTLDALAWDALLTGHAVLRLDPPLPADAEVLAVHDDWRCAQMAFKVCSAAWPVVPVGQIPPDWVGTVTWEQVAPARPAPAVPGRGVG